MLIHEPKKAKYPSLTLVEVLCSFLKVKQGENEELLEYLTRFKTERDITFQLLGRGIIYGFTEKFLEYLSAAENAERKQVKKNELDKLLSVLFLHNANHDRFGELLVEYRKAYAKKDVKYPQDLSSMMDVMIRQPLRKKKKAPVKTPEKKK